jgi:hypothetical protein
MTVNYRSWAGGKGLAANLDFGVEIKKSVKARLELLFDLFFAAFKDVHGDVRLASVVQLQGCVAHLGNFIRGQKAHSIDQS